LDSVSWPQIEPDLEAKVLVELAAFPPRILALSLSEISSGRIWSVAELPCSLCRPAMIEAQCN
jgi:hypothetical protein